jgi:hypothetical protein
MDFCKNEWTAAEVNKLLQGSMDYFQNEWIAARINGLMQGFRKNGWTVARVNGWRTYDLIHKRMSGL